MNALATCSCCGHRTLSGAPPGTWLTCPVCYWTDEDQGDDAARTRLVKARRNFEQMGASAACWLGDVRAPTADEGRSDDWAALAADASPRERDRAALVVRIRGAFAGVPSAGRISLTASYRHDHDGAPAIEWDDRDADWQQLPGEVLDFFGRGTTPFVFGNDESFRYYMPAFMVRSLALGASVTAVRALDLAVTPGRSPDELSTVRILDSHQRATIASFLQHVALYEAPAPWAERALERVWRRVSDVVE